MVPNALAGSPGQESGGHEGDGQIADDIMIHTLNRITVRAEIA
jgi:hypothetical protein